ncbi:trehalose-phosphatase [Aminirod propionatiphilus]|uniref:Trehalose-phosphatase n=1 Tax=Aminirod propionatiphilus TaxID=3415223 RepID=A0ACD1DUQ4_9BACT|nr:trehalose-phosphatase [Synergistota bacterium]
MLLPEAFRHRLARARHALFMIDYDGTLAAFRARRDLAYPDGGVREGLERVIASGTRLVVISGREAAEVSSLLGIAGLEIWGCHGAQRRTADGESFLPSLTAEQQNLLAEAETRALPVLPEGTLERKPLSLAGHFRSLPPGARAEAARDLRQAWEPLVGDDGELRPFDGGLEFRFRRHHKGRAVATLIDEEREAVAAYAGDDETDEDAFRALRPSDLAILVAESDRPTAASLRLRRRDVPALLDEWAAIGEKRREGKR